MVNYFNGNSYFIKHRFIASETLPVDYSRGLFLFILNAAEIQEAKEILTICPLNLSFKTAMRSTENQN